MKRITFLLLGILFCGVVLFNLTLLQNPQKTSIKLNQLIAKAYTLDEIERWCKNNGIEINYIDAADNTNVDRGRESWFINVKRTSICLELQNVQMGQTVEYSQTYTSTTSHGQRITIGVDANGMPTGEASSEWNTSNSSSNSTSNTFSVVYVYVPVGEEVRCPFEEVWSYPSNTSCEEKDC